MHVDLHRWRFDWAGPPAKIGPGVADLARRAEAIGVRTKSFMDHYFQMEAAAPAEHPMLEGYSALSFVAGLSSCTPNVGVLDIEQQICCCAIMSDDE